MDAFTREVIQTKLTAMFTAKGHFNICDFDGLCELAGVVPEPRRYKILRALHCVDYREMSPGVREGLMDAVLSTLNSQPMAQFIEQDGKIVALHENRAPKFLTGEKL